MVSGFRDRTKNTLEGHNQMGWQLGIDLGTTYTAAAIYKDNKANIFSLGQKSAAIPTLVFIKENGEILTGTAAARRATSQPERLARGFKRRIGDETPLFLGGAPYHPEALMAEILKTVLNATETREGSNPDHIAISHPANWGDFKKDLLKQTIRLANLNPENVTLLTEPEAAAISYACNEKMNIGDKIAVYDLGGGTFDAAILERTQNGFQTLGKPEGIEQLGGVDFDAAVYAHVSKTIETQLAELDYDDPAAITAVARLKQDCTDAKEALSSDADATINVLLPNHQTQVRITRKEFEDLCRPAITSTIEATRRAITSANITEEDITKILLVGGSSRIPLVSQIVQSELGRPLAIDTHPKHAIALGAAYKAAGTQLKPTTTPTPTPTPTPTTTPTSTPTQTEQAGSFASANIPDDPNIDRKAGPVSQTLGAIPPTNNSSTPNQTTPATPPATPQPTSQQANPYQAQSTQPNPQPFRPSATSQPLIQGSVREKPRSKNGGTRAVLAGTIAVATLAIGGVAYASMNNNDEPSTTDTTVVDPESLELNQVDIDSDEDPSDSTISDNQTGATANNEQNTNTTNKNNSHQNQTTTTSRQTTTTEEELDTTTTEAKDPTTTKADVTLPTLPGGVPTVSIPREVQLGG